MLRRLQNVDLPLLLGPVISTMRTGSSRFKNSIRQIVGILLDNAIKYSKEGEDGSCEDILLKLEKKNHQIILTVQNSSERVDESRNSKAGGYGLGLSIAKAMVEAHRGKISATAPDQKSVKITVILPIK